MAEKFETFFPDPRAEAVRATLEARFREAGIPSPRVEASILLAELGGCTPLQQLAAGAEGLRLAPEALMRLGEALTRRLAREPLQYILGTAPFRDLELEVTPAVLIPRPETEVLVDHALAHLPHGGTLLDVGTGSGAIALSAGQERPDAKVTALDVSEEALTVAERNRERHHISNVEFRRSDLFSAVEGERFHVICANLPYVTEEEYAALEPEVRVFEPKLALVAEDAGCSLMERLCAQLQEHLLPGGFGILEMSPPQTIRLQKVLADKGFRTEILKDLTGRARFVTALSE